MRGNAVVIVKNPNNGIGYPDIYLAFDESVRDGVWHPVNGYVIIEMNGGLFPFRQFMRGSR